VDEQFIVRVRVALIYHVGAMLDAGVLSGDRYLAVLQRFAEDPVSDVTHTVMDGLANVENAFITPDLEDAFARYVRATLRPALDRIGMRKTADEDEVDTAMRPTLLEWLGEAGRDPAVLDYAEVLAREYMTAGSLPDPSLAGVALELAAIRGDRTLFEEYRGRFETAQIPADRQRYLTALGAFREAALIDAALQYALEGPLRPQEIWTIPAEIASYSPNRDLVFDWMMSHYDEIRARIPPMLAPFFPYAAAGCSSERLATAERFFADPAHDPPSTQIELAKVAEAVTTCVMLREREGDAVRQYLLEQ